MLGIPPFESDFLAFLVAGEERVFALLRAQVALLQLEKYEQGPGWSSTDFVVANQSPLPEDMANFEVGDVEIHVVGWPCPMDGLLFIRDRKISLLECFTYTEDWPTAGMAYSFKYRDLPRKLPQFR